MKSSVFLFITDASHHLHATRSLHSQAFVIFKKGHGVPAAVFHEERKQKVDWRLGIGRWSRLFSN